MKDGSEMKETQEVEKMKYYAGVDGGATKSKGILISTDGAILAEAVSGPSNKNNIGIGKVVENLTGLMNELRKKSGIDKITAAGLGLSGAGRSSDQEEIRQALTDWSTITDSVFVHHDAFASLMGAPAGEDGVIAIAGTGSIAYGIKNDVEARAGGWGYLVGDEGSGYCIGNLAIRKALNHFDGTESAETLHNALLDFYKIQVIKELIPMIYSSDDPKGTISGCCELVYNLAYKGDAPALQVIDDSNGIFARQIFSVLKQLELEKKTVYSTGSLFKHPVMIENLKNHLKSLDDTIELKNRKFSPEIGMVLAAIKHSEGSISDEFIKKLEVL